MHINVLEPNAILFGLRSLCEYINYFHIKILSKNTTAVHCINSMDLFEAVGLLTVTNYKINLGLGY